MIKRLIYIALCLVFLFSSASCVKEDLRYVSEQDDASGKDGVDLTFVVDIEKLRSSVKPETKAYDPENPTFEQVQNNVKDDYIHSLAFFVIKVDVANYKNNRLVAYRLISPPASDGNYYLSRNPSTGVWDASTKFDKDDQYYSTLPKGGTEPYGYGYNGFAELKEDGSLATTTDYSDDGTIYPKLALGGKGQNGVEYGPGEFLYDFTTFRDVEYKAGDPLGLSKAIILTFRYDNPMHGDVEKLVNGTYHLLAIANFRESISEIFTYTDEGFVDNRHNIGQEVHNLLYGTSGGGWDEDNGLARSSYIGFLHGAVSLSTVTLSDDGLTIVDKDAGNPSGFIRSKRAYIVSSAYSVMDLEAGVNIMAMPLQRNVSRVTFDVTNNSSEDLTVSDFSLSSNFAQGATYLFSPVEDAMNFVTGWQRSPVVSDSKAIVPFPADGKKVIAGSIASAGFNNEVIFDALTYPSGSADKQLSYNITLTYQDSFDNAEKNGQAGHVKEYSFGTNQIGYTALVKKLTEMAVGESFTSVLHVQRGNKYLVAGSDADALLAPSSGDFSHLDHLVEMLDTDDPNKNNGLWQIEKRSNSTVRIKSLKNNKYLRVYGDPTDRNPVSFVTSASDATVFTVTQDTYGGREPDNNYFVLSYRKSSETGYLHNLNNSGSVEMVWINTWNDDGSRLSAFELNEESYNPFRVTKTIPVSVFDSFAGVSSDLHFLRRNEHLNVHLGVTYNPESQEIEFEVENWVPSDNYVTFE